MIFGFLCKAQNFQVRHAGLDFLKDYLLKSSCQPTAFFTLYKQQASIFVILISYFLIILN